MLIFHEGLPRSGKSYAAMVDRIIPALQAGRTVIVYIEGIDHGKIAVAAGLHEARVRELLVVMTREQVVEEVVNNHTGKVDKRLPHWLSCMVDNALVVLDEAQNFWGNRTKLSEGETKFVAEHGHRGIDLVLMGQDVRDVHALWRRRIEFKAVFLKLSGVGLGQRFSLTTWRHLGSDKWERASTKVRKYDPKYFGTYASHVSSDVQTGDYKDSRSTVFGSGLFKYGVPVALVLGVWGFYAAWKFFHPAASPVVASSAVVSGKSLPVPRSSSAPASSAAASTVGPDKRSAQEKYFSKLTDSYRVRLGGLLSRHVPNGPDRITGVVEWVEGGSHVMERMSLDQLREAGAALVVFDGAVRVVLGEWQVFATQWPLENDAKVSENRVDAMRPARGFENAVSSGPVNIGPSAPVASRGDPVGGSVDNGGRGKALPKVGA